MKFFKGIRLRLIDHWNLIFRQWSFIFNSVATALFGYLLIAPDAVIRIWNSLPDEVKQLVPEQFSLYIPLVLYILGLISKYIKQQNLDDLRTKNNGVL